MPIYPRNLTGTLLHLPAPPHAVLAPPPPASFTTRASCATRGRVSLTPARALSWAPNLCGAWTCARCASRRRDDILVQLALYAEDHPRTRWHLSTRAISAVTIRNRAQRHLHPPDRLAISTTYHEHPWHVVSGPLGALFVPLDFADLLAMLVTPARLSPATPPLHAPLALPGPTRIDWAGSWRPEPPEPLETPILRNVERQHLRPVFELAMVRAVRTFGLDRSWDLRDPTPARVSTLWWSMALRAAAGQLGLDQRA